MDPRSFRSFFSSGCFMMWEKETENDGHIVSESEIN